MELIPDIKYYDWGKLGGVSEVAKLAAENHAAIEIGHEQTYAEWWMGDHVSGSSTLKSNGQPLSDVLRQDSSLIGGMQQLPFLLKVLSIRKALSVQVHPSKVCMQPAVNIK